MFFSFPFPSPPVFKWQFLTILLFIWVQKFFKSLSTDKMAFSMITWSPPACSSSVIMSLSHCCTLTRALCVEQGVGRYPWLPIPQQAFSSNTNMKWGLTLAQCSCGPNVCVSSSLIAYKTQAQYAENTVALFQYRMEREGQGNDWVVRSVPSPLQELMSLHITAVGLVTLFLVSACTLSGISLHLCYPCLIA